MTLFLNCCTRLSVITVKLLQNSCLALSIVVSLDLWVAPSLGNYHRSNYGGTGSTSYSGSGITNNLGMNAGSPGLGQGSGQPIPVRRNHGPGSQTRGYPTMAPISPSMPHPVGPGMGPPSLAASNRKPQEVTVAANSTHSR